jgi:hypothetical protein
VLNRREFLDIGGRQIALLPSTPACVLSCVQHPCAVGHR